MMVDMLRTHPKLMLGGMLIDNPHYLTPDDYRAVRSQSRKAAATAGN